MVKKLLTIRIDEDKREDFIDRARLKGTSASVLVNTWIDKYLDGKLDIFDENITVDNLEAHIDKYLDNKLDGRGESMGVENLEAHIDKYLDNKLDGKIDKYLDKKLDSHKEIQTQIATLEQKIQSSPTRDEVNQMISSGSETQDNGDSVTMADVEKAIAKSSINITSTLSDTVGKMVNAAVEEKLSAFSDNLSELVDTAVKARLNTLSDKASDAKDVDTKLSELVRKTSATPDKKKRKRTSSDKEASRNRTPAAKADFPVGFPGGLTQADLGKRLGTTSTTVAKSWSKGKIFFRAWSKKLDPDGISWEFRSTSNGVKYYYPWLR